MASVAFESVRKIFGKTTALKDVDLLVRDGEFMVLLGPSGCGKTTLLRCLAGLERIDGGTVRIGDRDVSDLPPRDRHIAMVFQSYAVFPHMKVYDNIAFGLRMRKKPKAEVERRVKEGAALLQLEPYLDRYPAQLSGGQRQRVAVARAVVTDAPVLLMDEPLSNLDALLRLHARAELKRLHGEVRRTTVYVTHDQIEALSMGDRIAVMREGQIVQLDTPSALYDRPADVFVGSFIGSPPMNFLKARSRNGTAVSDAFEVPGPPGMDGKELLLGIRPENIKTGEGPLRGRVLVVEPLGSHALLTVMVGNESIKVVAPADTTLRADEELRLAPEPHKIRWMDAASGKALTAPH
ncbi:MAG TPA: ABC transporter ATP-binding protein [Candidatus Polarisedimenticolia bacterium]|jgi:multiple sugar transport system ATP-binding protein|nr:ABC transporter ATP-binding protein [Candidatus Polarisedimenticolia bacterium]